MTTQPKPHDPYDGCGECVAHHRDESIARTQPLRDLVARKQIIGTGSAALGVPVTLVSGARRPLGVVVGVSENGPDYVWVHRYDDEPDVSALYSVRELEIATRDDMADVGRMFAGRLYRDHRQTIAALTRSDAPSAAPPPRTCSGAVRRLSGRSGRLRAAQRMTMSTESAPSRMPTRTPVRNPLIRATA